MSEQGQGGGPGREAMGRPEPEELLGELAAMRRRTRSARHAYWFPLVLFGLLSCAAVPLYVAAAVPHLRHCVVLAPGHARCSLVSAAVTSAGNEPVVLGGMPIGGNGFYLGWYWLVALVLGYLLTVLWYRWHARQAGVQTSARGYLVIGVAATVLAVVIPPLASQIGVVARLWRDIPGNLLIRGTFAFLIIAAGLWVLAWAERSVALVITAAVYTGTALLASLYNVENILFRLGWRPGFGDLSLTAAPNVLLPAAVLLIAGAAAFAAQRPRRPVRPS